MKAITEIFFFLLQMLLTGIFIAAIYRFTANIPIRVLFTSATLLWILNTSIRTVFYESSPQKQAEQQLNWEISPLMSFVSHFSMAIAPVLCVIIFAWIAYRNWQVFERIFL